MFAAPCEASVFSKPLFAERVATLPEPNGLTDAIPDSVQTSSYTGPKCSIGNSFSDQQKISRAFDKLGSFVMESYDPELKTISSLEELFEVTDSDEETHSHVRRFRELQLEDTIPPPVDDGSQTSEEEERCRIEEVPDAVFQSRTIAEQRTASGSKRKSCDGDQRRNYIKHNFRRKRRAFPSRAKTNQKRKSKKE